MKYTLDQLNKMVEESNGGSLGLNGLTSIPEGFNPTVGGDLGLDGLTSIPEGFNPTIRGIPKDANTESFSLPSFSSGVRQLNSSPACSAAGERIQAVHVLKSKGQTSNCPYKNGGNDND